MWIRMLTDIRVGVVVQVEEPEVLLLLARRKLHRLEQAAAEALIRAAYGRARGGARGAVGAERLGDAVGRAFTSYRLLVIRCDWEEIEVRLG